MTNTETSAAPRNTEEQLVGQTFTLWLWPYFCHREEARPVVSGLTKDKADAKRPPSTGVTGVTTNGRNVQ